MVPLWALQNKDYMNKQIRILLVDDEQDNLIEYEGILRDLTDYTVKSVDSSIEAIEMCRCEYFDILVTDVRMPGKYGDEMFAEIKKILPDIRCIVTTGFAGEESAVKFLKLGAHDFLRKSEFDSQTLVKAVDNQVQIVVLKRQTDNLQQQVAEFHASLQEIMRTVQSIAQLSRSPELTNSLTNLVELAVGLCNAPIAVIFLPDATSGNLQVQYAVGVERCNIPPLKVGQGIAGRTAQSGRVSVLTRDPGGHWPGDEVEGSVEAGRQSVASIPLLAQNVCIGVLEVFDKESFTTHDLELLSRLSELGATTLDIYNTIQMADQLLLRALKLVTDTRASDNSSHIAEQTANKALSGIAETIQDIDLVGSGQRASAIAEQIRQISTFGTAAEACAENLLSNVLELLHTQQG